MSGIWELEIKRTGQASRDRGATVLNKLHPGEMQLSSHCSILKSSLRPQKLSINISANLLSITSGFCGKNFVDKILSVQ